ncbi:hypothetical protein AWH56_018650 [Anaerobacillus isosaccharinicus]|uniref:Uncharacterized protein n=1 Tax=Anaerobacillus isosaccharinicus TaxID=1532552 RepID=A0A1S2M7J8_9BACI|nr:hypothetical protein [Anaerobacillus isosaccharinicus]MBA5587075.1 hypothetical protein [Anaerobacillus isosaccharinicus]QOY34729.1 hypothetical protein AWH56_018650 [Anaerobacillus isosaccharinicus]
MNDEFKGYLHDLVIILHQKYNDTLQLNTKETEENKAFRVGMNHAYYDVLDVIESQLTTSGYDVNQIGKITPQLSKKATLK